MKEKILERFDEEGRVLFGGVIHTVREELEAAIDAADGANHSAPNTAEPPVSAEVVSRLESAIEDAQAANEELDRQYQAVITERDALKSKIGEVGEGEHPDEIEPRAATFMAERKNWITEVDQLRSSVSDLTKRLGELTIENEALKAAVAETPAPTEVVTETPPAEPKKGGK